MMIAAMMVAAVSANAQFEAGTFSIQPKAGFNASWLTNADANVGGVNLSKSPYIGALLGVEAEYQLAPKFSLAAGANYTLQGTAWGDLDYMGTKREDSKIELGYVTVPVTANYYIFEGFAVKTGVQFGFMTNAKEKYTIKTSVTGTETKTEFDTDLKDGCKKFDLSIPIGVSYQFKVPIVLDLRYNLGLTKINKDGDSMKNNVIQLTVGYKFAL